MTEAELTAYLATPAGQAHIAATIAIREKHPQRIKSRPLVPPEKLGMAVLQVIESNESRGVRYRPCIHLGLAIGFDNIHNCDYEGHDFLRCIPRKHKCAKSKDAELRSCLDCPHHVPAWPFAASHWMSNAAVRVHLENGPRHGWPNGWTGWVNVRDVMRELTDEAIAATPPAPAGEGRGIVTCGGGKYEPGVYILAKMLRHVGCELPLQVWHRGAEEPVSDLVRSLPGVEVRDMTALPPVRSSGGWQSKIRAIMNCGFADAVFFDADAYPAADPTPWLDHNPTGLVIWPDKGGDDLDCKFRRFHASSYGLAIPTTCPRINGGHYVVNVAKAWPVLWLHHHYDMYSDFWYQHRNQVGGYGDQDQMRAAIDKLKFPFHRYAETILDTRHGGWVQAGHDGRPGVVHRVGAKFGEAKQFHRPPARCPGVPLEDEAWRFFEEWLSVPRPARERVIPSAGVSMDTLATLIIGGTEGWPDRWQHWPATREAMDRSFIQAVTCPPPCPPLAGDGIVTCGGGRYDASVYVNLRMIRHLGCTLPVQVWYDGERELHKAITRAIPGVDFRDLSTLGLRFWGGFASASAAVANCGFARVLYLDADCYPTADPTYLFDQIAPDAAVVFPDYSHMTGTLHPDMYPGLDPAKLPPALNSGQYLLDLAAFWPTLSLMRWLDDYGDYWHVVGGYTDQDQLRAALGLTGVRYRMACEFPGSAGGDIPIFNYTGFLHRIGAKFAPPGVFDRPVRRYAQLPMEKEAWGFFEEWSAA